MTDKLVIFLHGVGSRGDSLAGLGTAWAGGLPGAAFETPDAPHPFDGGGPGRQWFSVAGVTADNRAERVRAARHDFDRLLKQLVADHGLTDRPERVALVGFSQGSIMALDAVASGRWRFGAVVAFSGRLASPQPLTPAVDTPVLLVHGTADPVMPFAESEAAAAALSALGVSVELTPSLGTAHAVARDGADAALAFLGRRLA